MSDATYRFELSKTGRAGCQNSACKHSGLKIEKGELRFGTLVNFQDHFTWKWKHWGCVTPAQIKNIQDQVGPLEDLDLDQDLPSILDGYDELSPEACEKVKFALLHGHVADEDWKGDPEKNRPGQKGINKRTPKSNKKKNVQEDDDAAGADEETPTKPKVKKPRAKKVKAEPENDEDDLALLPQPKKKAAGRKVKTEDDEDELALPPLAQKSKGRKRKPADQDEDDEKAEDAKPKRKPRAKKIKTEDQNTAIDSDQPLNHTKARAPAKKAKKAVDGDGELDEDPISAQPAGSDDAPAAEPETKGKKARTKKLKRESLDEDDAPLTSKSKADKTKKANRVKAEPREDVGAGAELSPPAQPFAAADASDEEAEEPVEKPKKKKATKSGPGKARGKGKST